MDLNHQVETLRQQLLAIAETGDAETRAAVERISTALEPAVRLAVLEAVTAAAAEITREIAPGAVEVRLRGTNPEFVVTLPANAVGGTFEDDQPASPPTVPNVGSDGETSRLNLRLPEELKTRVEEAARREGLSLNAWMVRTTAAALESSSTRTSRRRSQGSQQYTGWVQ